MTALPASPGRRLVRDRTTVALDATFLIWGWFLYCFSPTVPLLATEQGVSLGTAGLHGTALAVGTVIAGLLSERVARTLGRRRQIVLGAATTSVGVVALLIGPGLAWTLSACVIAAVGGNLTLAGSQPALLDHHGPAGPAAVTEANAYATAVGLLAPLALGLTVGAGLGWRPAVAITLVATLGSSLLVLREPGTGALGVPAAPQTTTHHERSGLGPTYWWLWVATVSGVAIELSTTFWASELVRERAGATEAVAASVVASLLAGMTVVRLAVPRLTRRTPAAMLLLAGYAVAAAGWLVFWLATTPWLAVVGLFVAGLGYGTHYPLAVSLLIRAAGDRPDLGQARALLGVGAAVGVAPFLLGAAADVVGAHTAFLLVPLLLVVATAALTRVLRTTGAGAL
ncbi:MFS transporter [Actinotalea sp. M2MS4P-6]|uniref:MFS transporter n=1 Tax=Actinotalea sp. M2MS4P-6 TaxID=2983762 RepID=UPI0021E41FEE|nr:MFS transporter [Actinotalea sp. M2MS4P-6]MCV2395093.1 MFS transporter [Actinotalea sp. M2MS4P-6]